MKVLIILSSLFIGSSFANDAGVNPAAKNKAKAECLKKDKKLSGNDLKKCMMEKLNLPMDAEAPVKK
jgi:hypothetical protein